jgi:NaMN:DMB phosphoribosyltransferase
LQLGEILGTDFPMLQQPQMVVFAADHGLTARSVSAFPSDVSWQMVENFLAGGAAVSVLAKQMGIALTVVDCGVKRDFSVGLPAGKNGETPQRPGLLARKIAVLRAVLARHADATAPLDVLTAMGGFEIPGGLTQNLFFCISAQLRVDRRQEFNQISVTPARHRHDSLQIGQVVGGQQTWVGQRDDTFDRDLLDDS